MNVQEVAKGFPNNPAIIQDVRITGKESCLERKRKSFDLDSKVLQRLSLVIGQNQTIPCQNRHGPIMYRPYQGLIQG
jgi:hypothetical protein